MSKVRVQCMGMSIDGFAAGPRQDLQNPLGVGGFEIMKWFISTDAWKRMHGLGEGEKGVDNAMALAGFENLGAWILGRNMFGPIRGPWPDDEWKGWWGEEPPYHVPTFVLTHYPRDPIPMKGDTTFHFVTDGIRSALEKAKAAAGPRDIRIGGGASTVRQFLQERLIDEMHLAVRPVLLGSGEKLLDGLDLRELGYECTKSVMGEGAMHVFITKRA